MLAGIELRAVATYPTKHSSKQESLPFIAAFCAWIASQDIDNRSRGAAIDPESFRDSAYAPRHPIDLALHHVRFACS